jgi:hypothetical protein
VRLDDFERSGRGRRTRYVTAVRDSAGAENYELVVAGEGKLLRRIFEQTELGADIRSKLTDEAWEQELREVRELELEAFDRRSRLEDVPGLLKKPPAPATVENSTFVSLRRTGGEGTTFSLSISNFFLPSGFRVFLALPPVCDCIAVVRPTSGDQDLFVHRDFPFFGPIIAASVDPGTSVDMGIVVVLGCTFFSQFVPWFQIFGFSSGVCGSFTASGRDVFG